MKKGEAMTEEDKQLVAGYMGWRQYKYPPYYLDKNGNIEKHSFDSNDASLVVQKMQKRGDDYVKFIKHAYDMAFDDGKMQFHTVTAWLFNADNFFTAFVEWRKGNEPTNT